MESQRLWRAATQLFLPMALHGSPTPDAGDGDFGRGSTLTSSGATGYDGANVLGKTRRERLSDLLFSAPDGVSLEQIEKILEVRRTTAIADLEHLRLSFKHRPATLLMVPPTCGDCGYTFRLERAKAPSRCPECKSRDLTDPIFKAEPDT